MHKNVNSVLCVWEGGWDPIFDRVHKHWGRVHSVACLLWIMFSGVMQLNAALLHLASQDVCSNRDARDERKLVSYLLNLCWTLDGHDNFVIVGVKLVDSHSVDYDILTVSHRHSFPTQSCKVPTWFLCCLHMSCLLILRIWLKYKCSHTARVVYVDAGLMSVIVDSQGQGFPTNK